MLNNRPDIDGTDGKQAHQRDHDDQHQLAVAIDGERALKLYRHEAVMDKRHDAAENDAEKHPHINDLEAKNKGLAAAV